MGSRFKKESGETKATVVEGGDHSYQVAGYPNRYPNQQPKEELLRLDPFLHEAGADPVDRTEESKCDFTV